MITLEHEFPSYRHCLLASALLHLLFLILLSLANSFRTPVMQNELSATQSVIVEAVTLPPPINPPPLSSSAPLIPQTISQSSPQTVALSSSSSRLAPSQEKIHIDNRQATLLARQLTRHHMPVKPVKQRLTQPASKLAVIPPKRLPHKPASHLVKRENKPHTDPIKPPAWEQFAALLKKQSEKTLQQPSLHKNIKHSHQLSAEKQGEVDKYKALILHNISHHWVIPVQTNKQLYCDLLIHIAPGGGVLAVQIVKTSGNVRLDDSARRAVLKSSPLPVPHDPTRFALFKQIVLRVRPENLLSS